MRFPAVRSARLVPYHILLVAAPLAWCSISLAAQETPASPRIATRAFSLVPPQGKGWATTFSADSLGVQFVRTKKGFPPFSSPEVTTIEVLLNATTPENAARGRDSVAKDFMDQEEAQLRAGTYKSLKQDVVLKRAHRDTASIAGYYLYLFEPSLEMTSWEGRVQSDQQLYLYFPPDFESRGQFFLFHIAKEHPPKNLLEKGGFKEIRLVIGNFRDERAPVS